MARLNVPTQDLFFERLRKTEQRLAALERRHRGNVLALVRKNAAQAVSDDSTETVTWDDVLADPSGLVDGNVFVAPADGIYLAGSTITWEGHDSATAGYALKLWHLDTNGNPVLGKPPVLDSDLRGQSPGFLATTNRVVSFVELLAGERVRLEATLFSAGGALDILGSNSGEVSRAYISRIG
jgi:hypothetical protein